jgi:cytochrome c-type biogenesis protein CcmH/NrfG
VVSDSEEFLRRSLEDLERERAAGDLSDADYADLRARYESRLARSVSDHRLQETAGRHRTRWGRAVVTVVVVAVVGVGGGLALARWSGEREPGEQLSGQAPPSASGDLARAARLFQEGDASGAVDIYRSMLDENPEDVDALTYMGWTLRNVSVQQEEPRLLEAGIGFLEEALEIEPAHAEAWFFRGLIFLRDEDDPDRAVDALRLALANDPGPEVEAAARGLLAEIAQGD